MASAPGECVNGAEVGLAAGWYVGFPSSVCWSWWDADQCGFAIIAAWATRYPNRAEADRMLAESDIGQWMPAARVVEVL